MSTLHRNRKEELRYRKQIAARPKSAICTFCDKDNLVDEIISELKNFIIITNRFPYTLWDSSTVVEQLMVVPKRHIHSIQDFSRDEIIEHHKLTSEYEIAGYDVYARSNSSNMKSIAHQHTHLIKTNGIKIKGLIYNERPLIHVIY